MIKIIFLVAIGYGLYRSLKTLVPPRQHHEMDGSDTGRIDDIMAKDPICLVYLPQREAIRYSHGGQDYFFCSQDCLDVFKRRATETDR